MKTNFISFKNPEEIEKFFQDRVKINHSMPDNVLTMLDELGLHHSPLVHIDKSKQTSPSFSFNYVISSSIPARPTMLIFANKWMVYFQFDDDKFLAKIEVIKFSDGI